MKKLEIMNKAGRAFNTVGFRLKKHSPEILVAAGVIGTVTSAVMACKATLKVNDVINESKNDISKIHEATENGCTEGGEEYTETDSKKDLTIVYAQTGVKLFKLYAPAVALGTLSIAGILKSNSILRKRNVALAAAYATVDKSFKEYRNRVIERFGQEMDRELKYNIKAKEIEEVVVDEKGKEKKVKKSIDVVDISKYSQYAKFFDSASREWEDDPEYNLMFLRRTQEYVNDLLKVRKRVFLNEVLDLLDIPRVKEGQIVGWVYDPTNPDIDSYIDFGIYETHRANRNFVNGYEPTILLDFNVDGNIWENM